MRQLGPFAVALSAGVLAVVGFSLYDLIVLDRLPHVEGPPRFDGYHLLRMAALLALSAWIVASLPNTAWAVGARSGSARRRLGRLCWLGSFAVSGCAMLFLVSPYRFNALSLEDRPVEWAGALLLLAGAVVAVLTSFRLRDIRGRGSRTAGVLTLAFGVLLFVLGMEELSWMQRVFAIDTPAAFSGNRQRELNLHNFITNEAETLFYTGAFVLLILLPFVCRAAAASAPPGLHVVLPGPAVAVAAAPMAAYNWDMWNIVPVQMTFWLTLMLMATAAWRCYRRDDALWRAYGVLAVCLAFAQAIFIAFGDALVRGWEVTEYKEFFIAVGMFVFAMQIWSGVRSKAAATDA